MKNTIFHIYAAILVICSYPVKAQDCPPEGSPKPGGRTLSAKEKELNVYKNTNSAIPHKKPVSVDINTEILSKPRNDDADQFKQGQYVTVVGYLVSSEEQGPETCNCDLASKKDKTGDMHIYIGETADAKKKDCIVVEITPSFKALHSDYAANLANLDHHKVNVTGYLAYDYIHEKNSVNMCTTCTPKAIWRKSCWEVHPVVKIELY